MKLFYFLGISAIFLSMGLGFAQSRPDSYGSILQKIENQDTTLLKNHLALVKSKDLQNVLAKYAQLKFEQIDSAVFNQNEGTSRLKLVQLLAQSKISKNQKVDSLAFLKSLEALKLAQTLNDYHLVNLTYRNICEILLPLYQKTPQVSLKYASAYQKIANSRENEFWASFYQHAFLIQVQQQEGQVTDSIVSSFLNLEAPNINYALGRKLQMDGIMKSSFKKDFSGAIESYTDAIGHYELLGTPNANRSIASCKFNIGTEYFDLKKYQKCIDILQGMKNKRAVTFADYFEKARLKWIIKSFDSLHQADSSLFYLKQLRAIEQKERAIKKAMAIEAIDKKYEVHQKTKELEEEKDLNEKYQSWLLKLAAIFTLSVGVVLFLYKMNKTNQTTSKILKEKSTETLNKLEELKDLVIKNHIVLKDKTKVYISELLYIKSDDHYLELNLSTGKKHFVRGKMKEIKTQLPPNFIQCHRSYIVNKNFVKQTSSKFLTLVNGQSIPLSRSFKGEL